MGMPSTKMYAYHDYVHFGYKQRPTELKQTVVLHVSLPLSLSLLSPYCPFSLSLPSLSPLSPPLSPSLSLSLPLSLQDAVDIFGLSAIDRLFCFMIVKELQYFLRYLQRGLLKTPEFVKLVQGMISTLEGPEKLIREIYMFRISWVRISPEAAHFSLEM